MVIQDLSSGKIMGIGKESNGLYLNRGVDVGNQPKVLNSIVDRTAADSLVDWSCRVNNHSFSLWNKGCVHLPIVQLRNLFPLANQTRLPFPNSTSRTDSPFEMIHLDLWGTYKTPTNDGSRYFLMIVDDYSCTTCIFLP